MEPEAIYPFEIGVWWVDDVGDFHSSSTLDESFDAVYMRHLGQVRLAVTIAGVNVKWDSACVITEALEAVISRLSDSRKDLPVSLEFCFHGWSSDFGLTPGQAITRIGQVQAIRDIDILYPTRIREVPVSETADASPLIKSGFECYRHSGGRFDRYSNDTLAKILTKAMIYRPDSKENEIVFTWIGTQSFTMQMYGSEWARGALGQPLNQAQGSEEENFVSRISSAYDEIWATGEPRYQHVRSLIFRDGVEPEWLNYARLITRCVSHDGSPVLVCLSEHVHNAPVALPGTP